MVNQGDIVWLDFSPQTGHEQAGRRPAVVVSNNKFNRVTNLAILCPITNTNRDFPLHVRLDDRTRTTGTIVCEQVKALDINSRRCAYIESLPQDLLHRCVEIVFASIR
jgi:mRNA interferase MazF